MWIKYAVCLSILLLACGSPEHAQVKVGGPEEITSNDPLNRYTVIVRLIKERGDRFGYGSCSGTLLSKSYVLLAAHCVDGVWGAKVLVGHDHKISLSNGKEFRAVGEGMSFAVSKSYLAKGNIKFFRFLVRKATFRSPRMVLKDIAVIRLAEPLPLPYKIDFVIPDPDLDLTGQKVTIAGYGIGDAGQQPARARKATVKLARDFRKSDLLEFHNYFRSIDFGDSGGPVWWYDDKSKLNLIGVHSAKISFGRAYTWSIDIRHHRQWIMTAEQVLKNPKTAVTSAMDMSHRYFPAFMEKHFRQ